MFRLCIYSGSTPLFLSLLCGIGLKSIFNIRIVSCPCGDVVQIIRRRSADCALLFRLTDLSPAPRSAGSLPVLHRLSTYLPTYGFIKIQKCRCINIQIFKTNIYRQLIVCRLNESAAFFCFRYFIGIKLRYDITIFRISYSYQIFFIGFFIMNTINYAICYIVSEFILFAYRTIPDKFTGVTNWIIHLHYPFFYIKSLHTLPGARWSTGSLFCWVLLIWQPALPRYSHWILQLCRLVLWINLLLKVLWLPFFITTLSYDFIALSDNKAIIYWQTQRYHL